MQVDTQTDKQTNLQADGHIIHIEGHVHEGVLYVYAHNMYVEVIKYPACLACTFMKPQNPTSMNEHRCARLDNYIVDLVHILLRHYMETCSIIKDKFVSFTYTHIYMYTYTSAHIYLSIYTYIHICMYKHTRTTEYTYNDIHIYIHIHA